MALLRDGHVAEQSNSRQGLEAGEADRFINHLEPHSLHDITAPSALALGQGQYHTIEGEAVGLSEWRARTCTSLIAMTNIRAKEMA